MRGSRRCFWASDSDGSVTLKCCGMDEWWLTKSKKLRGQLQEYMAQALWKTTRTISVGQKLQCYTRYQQVPRRDVIGWKILHVTVHDPVQKGPEHFFLTRTSSANSTPSFPGKREVCFLPDINMHILTHTNRPCKECTVIAGWREPDLGKASMTLNCSQSCGESARCWKICLVCAN